MVCYTKIPVYSIFYLLKGTIPQAQFLRRVIERYTSSVARLLMTILGVGLGRRCILQVLPTYQLFSGPSGVAVAYSDLCIVSPK